MGYYGRFIVFLCEGVGSCKLVGDGLWWGVGVGGRRAATPVRSSFFILLALEATTVMMQALLAMVQDNQLALFLCPLPTR